MTLAPKLPYTHPFSGGYPRLGGQPLPTDPDAIDYLARVAAADGAAVEVGVAMAVDQFVKGCKADSAGYAGDPTRTVWDALQACCIMCGARTISGALVPLKGTAPTPYNFASGDYSRTTGLKGDGSTKYLDSGRANNADGQDDNHNAVYVTTANTASVGSYISAAGGAAGTNNFVSEITNNRIFTRNRSTAATFFSSLESADGFLGTNRSDSAEYIARILGDSTVVSTSSDGSASDPVYVFARSFSGSAVNHTDARLAFYSIGSSLDLAALDTRVTNLINGIKFHNLTGLIATDYDPDTVAYIVAAYEAGGTL